MDRKYQPSEIISSLNILNEYISGKVNKLDIDIFNPIEYYLIHSTDIFFQPDREKIDKGLIALLINDLKSRLIEDKNKKLN